MTEGQEHQWHIELDDMRVRLRYALANLNNADNQSYVRHQIEQVFSRLGELCELTKGESK